MEDSETEPTEAEPLMQHGQSTKPKDNSHSSLKTEPKWDPSTQPSTSHSKPSTSHGVLHPCSPRPPRRKHEVRSTLAQVPEKSERTPEESAIDSIITKEDSTKGESNEAVSPSLFCPIFGVKNYLHHFYEKPEVKNAHLYEDIPQEYLTEEGEIYLVKQRDACSSPVFRLSLILGGLILLLGTVAFIVAACATRRSTLVGQVGGVAVVDKVATAHNAEVDALLLVGLVAVTLGSTVIASALISRAFCSRSDDLDPFHVTVLPEAPPTYTTGRKVPVTEQLTPVQPTWKSHGYASIGGLVPVP